MWSGLLCLLVAASLIAGADVRMGKGNWRGATRPWPAHPELLVAGTLSAGFGALLVWRSRRERRRKLAEARARALVEAFGESPAAPSTSAAPQEGRGSRADERPTPGG